ncbi:ATP-grasp domain-containing protein [Sulfurirhabdus autotrophica]|uniref:Biotin carboxylase n=1 Tax=Sulfurirhabdus autotrophica TaxID=1706046 RepID=A0A4R3Y2J3_9PROT|nr:ATP-grasp domain-containing protein [Sulfurirhabdus autotrophica]TCV85910.1 biotin carboxylase [Sulfurirhabdus autotrophica]
MKRILLLLPASSYRNEDFIAAAKKLDVEIISAADYCHRLAPGWGMSPISSVPFDQPEIAVHQVMESLGRKPDAVLAVDDSGLELAALLSERLQLPGNPPAGVWLMRDKLAFRRLLRNGGLHCPEFYHLTSETQPEQACSLSFPVVVKARRLSSSRGVVRADTQEAFTQAVKWVNRIQEKADRDGAQLGLIVERFIPGHEYALEGLLEKGELRVLALFDKPDPLDGPYFEESIYITPPQLSQAKQDEIAHTVQQACQLAGIVSGPIHAEMRLNEQGVWLLEIATRSIGGLCGRMLQHALGMSLEELILRHALNMPLPKVWQAEATGVMMIPIPKRGILKSVHHLDEARQVPGISDIKITASAGQIVSPSPEGASYLGFIFASGISPDAVESSLRHAHSCLQFDVQTEIPVTNAITHPGQAGCA